MKNSAAVILPQGCDHSLYNMARANCPHVFPNYNARFNFPGKIGQIRLFRKTGIPHPVTKIYPDLACYQHDVARKAYQLPLRRPFVFKFDWGGQGETVYQIGSDDDLAEVLSIASKSEKSGQRGFLIQEYIPHQNRTLRVVIIGRRFLSYWRIQKNSQYFQVNLSKGATLDMQAEPELRQLAVQSVQDFCRKTDINLAGFDVIFSTNGHNATPLFLEINYFFGRKGLGGSEAYYEMLNQEIRHWLRRLGFSS